MLINFGGGGECSLTCLPWSLEDLVPALPVSIVLRTNLPSRHTESNRNLSEVLTLPHSIQNPKKFWFNVHFHMLTVCR